jgi:hypothetical protein
VVIEMAIKAALKAATMDKKKLDTFRKKLETRRQELSHMVVRNQKDGRTADDEATQDVADRAASSYNKEFLFSQSNNDRRASAKAASGNAFRAAKRLTPSGWKLSLGRGTASNARKKRSRVCWKPHNRFAGPALSR